MLKFTDLNQEYPDKRLSKDRKKDFREIYDNFIKNSAKERLVRRCSSHPSSKLPPSLTGHGGP